MAHPIPFPGPPALGRGLVLDPDDSPPEPAASWPQVVVDAQSLADPASLLDQLDRWWRERTPSVVVLAVPFADLKAPERVEIAPYRLDPSFQFTRERVHFLVWANRYDGRGGELRWHHTDRAVRLGADRGDDTDVIVDNRPYWVDGGPRRSDNRGSAVIHVESVWAGRLQPDTYRPPSADLAPDQLAAVSHPEGPARIIAPAGSGKTRVLTERLRHLVADRHWEPESVTALAYNRRAAGEMAERLADVQPVNVRTLHSFGYEILTRSHGERPRLLAEGEIRRILDRLLSLRPRANEDVHAPYLEALTEVRTALRDPEEVEAEREDVPGFGAMFDEYRAALGRSRTIDHDEQIYGALECLLTDPEVRAWAQARCRHLLVDEFQDLTPAHLLMVRLVAAPGYDVFGVGDDDQVIYGYAGATPRFLIEFDRYFPGAASYQLEVNYRCPAPVVVAASRLLGHSRVRIDKHTRPRPGAATKEIEVVRSGEADIGGRLVEVVADLVDRDGPGSTVVLSRVNVGLLVPQIVLAEAGIGTDRVIDTGFLDRSGIRTALAWLRLGSAAASDLPLDGSDLDEVTRRPARGLSPGVRTALGRGTWPLPRLVGFARGSNDNRTRDRLLSLASDIQLFADLVEKEAPVAERLLVVRDHFGLGQALTRLDGSRTHPTGGHTDDLDALIMLAHTHPEVEDLEPWLRGHLDRRRQGEEGVSLSTVHRVKGLEWRRVVVFDSSAGLMPHRLATDMEEERRIFHVAITRCSESVTVLTRAGQESPFLGELWDQVTSPTQGR